MEKCLTSPSQIALLLILTALSVLGNILNLPLFFSVSLIFGSIFSLTAVRLCGLPFGAVIALVGGAYTWFLWGHPYAMIIFGAEALFVGLTLRRLPYLAVADAAFWLVLGAPLVLLFYSGVMGMSFDAAGLIALKQPLNGIFNAILAEFLVIVLRSSIGGQAQSERRIPIAALQFNILLFLALAAGAVPIVRHSQEFRDQEERHVAERLGDTGTLAAIQVGHHLKSVPDALDHRASLERFLEEVAGQIGRGITGLALVDDDDRRLSQWGRIQSLSGTGRMIDTPWNQILWQPDGQMPAMLRWRKSRYISRQPMPTDGPAAAILVEFAAEPVVALLDVHRFRQLSLLGVITLLAIGASWLLSRWLSGPVRHLSRISRTLNDGITGNTRLDLIDPGSRIEEYDDLARSLKEMAINLAISFRELTTSKETLEARVRERTRDLERLSMVASQTTNAVIITGLDGRIQWVNEGMTRISGFTAQELYGRKPGAVLAGAGTDPVTVGRMRAAIALRQPFHEELVNYHKDGTAYWVEIVCNPLREKNGEVKGFIAIESDISNRKRSDQALADAAEQTQAIIDNVIDGIITIDQRGAIQSLNKSAEIIFGYSHAEAAGRNVSLLMPEPDRGRHDQYLRNHAETGQARIIGIGREVEGLRKSGDVFPMELAVSRITRKGQVFFVGIVRDISERKRIEKLKSEFVSTVSHELRTPLTSISGALGLIAGGALGPLPEQADAMVALAQKNCEHLGHLINDLLDMEKIVAGKMSISMKKVSLPALMRQALEDNKTYGQHFNVTFQLEEPVPDVFIQVDPQRLLQILANYLSNAAKYSPEGGTVLIRAFTQEKRIRLEVIDHGPGIAKTDHGRIFMRFSQVDSSDTRKRGGTGLGLAISKELAERMGGEVGFDSEPGEGSVFFAIFDICTSD